jgi:hypothetical protein
LGLLLKAEARGSSVEGDASGGHGKRWGHTKSQRSDRNRCRSSRDAPCYRRDLLYALVRREDCVQVPELHGRRLHRVRLRSDDEGTSRSPDLEGGKRNARKKRNGTGAGRGTALGSIREIEASANSTQVLESFLPYRAVTTKVLVCTRAFDSTDPRERSPRRYPRTRSCAFPHPSPA